MDSNTKMSSYEYDLTWMAMRYAIGRNTISCCTMAKDMPSHIYDRLTDNQKKDFVHVIRVQLIEQLSFYPFNFVFYNRVGDPYNRISDPMQKFLNFLDINNINTAQQLSEYKSITYKCNKDEYEVVKRNVPTYESTDWMNLVYWAHFANLLDIDSHKFAVIEDKEGNKKPVEYFEGYERVSNNSIRFQKIKIPVEEFVKNAHFVYNLESYGKVLKDNLSINEAKKYNEENDKED